MNDFQGDLFGQPSAKQLRDDALKRVEENAGVWIDIAVDFVRTLPAGWIGMWEDVRLMPGLPPPYNEHANGVACKKCIQKKLLVPLGFKAPLASPSHASRKAFYRRTNTF